MALIFILVADGRLELFFLVGAPCLAGRLQAVALDRGQHAGGLLAAHDRDAGIRPGPQEAGAVGPAAHGVIAGAERAADDDGELRHVRTGHRRDHLGAVFRNAGLFVLFADHEAGDVLQKNQRDVALIAKFYEVRALERRLRKQDAVVGDDAHRITMYAGKARDQGGAVTRLEFLELDTVDYSGNDFAHFERVAGVVGQDAVDVFGRVGRLCRPLAVRLFVTGPVEVLDDVTRHGPRVGVVFGKVIGHARQPRMHVGAAQGFGVNFLAGGRLDQRRAAEKDRALFLDDNGLVAHGRHIGAAGRARTHHHGDLRNVLRRQPGLVVEDAAEVLLVRKHLVLQRQKSAAGIDQVDARQVVLQRDFLGPKVLLDRHRVIRAALDRRVIGDHHAFHALNAAYAGNHAGRRRLVVVQTVRGQWGDFQERTAGVEQRAHAFPRQKLAACEVFLARLFRTAAPGPFEQFAQLFGKIAMVFVAREKVRILAVYLGTQFRHGSVSACVGM